MINSHLPQARARRRAAACASLFLASALPGAAIAQQAPEGVGVAGPGGALEPLLALADPWTPPDPHKLYLVAATVDLAQRRADVAAAIGVARSSSKRHVLQFDGPMTPERAERLADAGVEVLGHLPINAFVVRLAGADRVLTAGLDFVRWHGEYQDGWKVNPHLGRSPVTSNERIAVRDSGRVQAVVTLFADATEAEIDAVVDAVRRLPGGEAVRSGEQAGSPIVAVRLRPGDAIEIARHDSVQFIDEAVDVRTFNDRARWVVQGDDDHPLYVAGLHGEGQIVGIIDDGFVESHCSFLDADHDIGEEHRKVLAFNAGDGFANPTLYSHGTHVAGTAVGDAGDNSPLRGVAYEARMVFHTFIDLSILGTDLKPRLETHHEQGARIHTNSWGSDFFVWYNPMVRAIDAFARENEDSLVLFACGNSQLLATPANAKNVVAVGGSQSHPTQANYCIGGRGPTVDGRRKPEIFAPGCFTLSADASTLCDVRPATGTSMATPASAGAAALVRQYYTDGYYPSSVATPGDALTPTGALIKATLINSCVNMTGIPGYPSIIEGWGRLSLADTLHFPGAVNTLRVVDVRNADGLSSNQSAEITFTAGAQARDLRVTLVWTDAPAAAGAAFAPVNELDLEVVAPNGDVYLGNWFYGRRSIIGGVADDRNNVEQVHLRAVQAGDWTIRVRSRQINSQKQGYALVISTLPTTATVVGPPLPPVPRPSQTPSGATYYDLPGFDTMPNAIGGPGGGAGRSTGGFDPGAERADVNGDGLVDTADLAMLLGAFGRDDLLSDLNDDGVVDGADLGWLLGAWGR